MKTRHNKTECENNTDTLSNNIFSCELADTVSSTLETPVFNSGGAEVKSTLETPVFNSGEAEVKSDYTQSAMLPDVKTNAKNKASKLRQQPSANTVLIPKTFKERKACSVRVQPTSFQLKSGKSNLKKRKATLSNDRCSDSSRVCPSRTEKQVVNKTHGPAKVSRMSKLVSNKKKYSCIVSGFSTDDMQETDKSALAKFYINGKATVVERPSCSAQELNINKMSKQNLEFPKMFSVPHSTHHKCFINKPLMTKVNAKKQDTSILNYPLKSPQEIYLDEGVDEVKSGEQNTTDTSNQGKTKDSLLISCNLKCAKQSILKSTSVCSSKATGAVHGDCTPHTQHGEDRTVSKRAVNVKATQNYSMGDFDRPKCQCVIATDKTRCITDDEGTMRRLRAARSPHKHKGTSRFGRFINPVMLCNRCCVMHPCQTGPIRLHRKLGAPCDRCFITRNNKYFLDGLLPNYEELKAQIPTISNDLVHDYGFRQFDNDLQSIDDHYYRYKSQGPGDQPYECQLASASSSCVDSLSVFNGQFGTGGAVDLNSESLHCDNCSGSTPMLGNNPMDFCRFWSTELSYFNNRGTFDGIHLSPFRTPTSKFNKNNFATFQDSSNLTDNEPPTSDVDFFSIATTDQDTNTSSVPTYFTARSLESRPLRRPRRYRPPRTQVEKIIKNKRIRLSRGTVDWPREDEPLWFVIKTLINPVMLVSAMCCMLLLFHATLKSF